MIEIPRSLCRDVLAVVRKLGRGRATAGLSLEFIAGRTGLTIQAATPDVAIRHHTPGRRPECRLVVPLETFIKSVERNEDPVLVRSDRPEQSVPKGRRRSGPEVQRSPTPGKETFPLLPARFKPCGSGLLAALDAASAVTARDDSSRFVLNRIQLRGRRGAVVATDSRQLLFQSGFQFPWTGDLLVPRSEVFATLAAMKAESVSVARTATHVGITAGPWTVALAIDVRGKFPDVDTLLDRIKRPASELILDPADRARLIRELPNLPGRNEVNKPVTLDLAGREVRAKGERDANPITIALAKSRVQGKPVRFACDRSFLLMALKFGLHRMAATTEDQPLVWKDATRTYLFLPLGADAVVPSTKPTRSRGVARMKDRSTVEDRHQTAPGGWTKPRPKGPPTPVRQRPRPNSAPPAPRGKGKPRSPKVANARPARRAFAGLWGYVRGLFRGRRSKPATR